MANPLLGEASLAIGDENFTIVLDINALVEAEEASGLDLDVLLDGLQRGRSLKVLRALFWAGLQRNHPCHLIRAGELMASAKTGEVYSAVSKAVIGAFPPAEEKQAKNPPKAAK